MPIRKGGNEIENSVKSCLAGLLALAVFALPLLAACGEAPAGSASAAGSANVPAATGVLDGRVQTATLDQVKLAINDLYSHHPSINTFAVQSVSYTPQTRDKVLRICSEGSVAVNDQERESQEVSACAPLIFFFYYYGRQNGVPEGVDVARKLYGYAVTGKSADSQKGLTDLLRSWGMQ